MKSLKECLLNEVRITVKNARVVDNNAIKKTFYELKEGDKIYRYIKKTKTTVELTTTTFKEAFEILFIDAVNSEGTEFNLQLAPHEFSKTFVDYNISAWSTNVDDLIKNGIKKF